MSQGQIFRVLVVSVLVASCQGNSPDGAATVMAELEAHSSASITRCCRKLHLSERRYCACLADAKHGKGACGSKDASIETGAIDTGTVDTVTVDARADVTSRDAQSVDVITDVGTAPDRAADGSIGSTDTKTPPVCMPLHGQCDATHPCCDGVACGSHYCGAHCLGHGGACSSSVDCCPGASCIEGKCKNDVGCALHAQGCSIDPADPLFCCDDTQTKPVSSSAGLAALCPGSSWPTNTRGTCPAMGCRAGAECGLGCWCKGYSCFEDHSTPTPVSGSPCLPFVGCVIPGATCTSDADCCSGSCRGSGANGKCFD
jgi:hypothetical protein